MSYTYKDLITYTEPSVGEEYEQVHFYFEINPTYKR